MFNCESYHGNATDKYTLDHKTKGGAKARQFTLHQLRKEPHHMSSYWVQLFQLRKTESLGQLVPFKQDRNSEATTPRDQRDTPRRPQNRGVRRSPCAKRHVDTNSCPIIGLPSCRELSLITLHCEIRNDNHQDNLSHPLSLDHLLSLYPYRFKVLGKFPGKLRITVDSTIPSVIDAARRVPIHIRNEVADELDSMC